MPNLENKIGLEPIVHENSNSGNADGRQISAGKPVLCGSQKPILARSFKNIQ